MGRAEGGLAGLVLLLLVDATWEEGASASHKPQPWRMLGGNPRAGEMGRGVGIATPPMTLHLRGGYGRKSAESRAAARRLIYREQYMRERYVDAASLLRSGPHREPAPPPGGSSSPGRLRHLPIEH